MINPAISRADFCSMVPVTGALLEIGPYAKPQFRRPQHDVYYADICTADQIRAQASQHGYNPALAPEHIDIMIDLDSDPTIVTDHRFQAIFSSHVIEHQPDLVRHLDEIAQLGQSEQVQYFVAIPDRRYCFDHFQPESTIAEVIGAHIERRRRLLPSTLLQNELFGCHNNEYRHWNHDHGAHPLTTMTMERLRECIANARRLDTEYIDSHAWRFTPESFDLIIELLYQLELQPWRCSQVYTTARGSNEFYAVLTRE